ncbi:MAG: hypothetical protein WCI74_16360 [Actinomycetes bacterium]
MKEALDSPLNAITGLVWFVRAGGVEVIDGAGIGVVPITHDQLVIALTFPA